MATPEIVSRRLSMSNAAPDTPRGDGSHVILPVDELAQLCRPCHECGKGHYAVQRIETLEGGATKIHWEPCSNVRCDSLPLLDSPRDSPIENGPPGTQLTVTQLRTLLSHIISGTTTQATSTAIHENNGIRGFSKRTYSSTVKWLLPFIQGVMNESVEMLRDHVKSRPPGSIGSWTALYVMTDTGWAKRSKRNKHGDSRYALTFFLDVITGGILPYDLITNHKLDSDDKLPALRQGVHPLSLVLSHTHTEALHNHTHARSHR
jgi:hypothetical protein